jgi:hypothetical protein
VVETEELQRLREQVALLEEQQNDAMRLIYRLHARAALNNPEKRLVVGIANRVVVEKMELEGLDEEILYKNSRKNFVRAKLPLEVDEDISRAQFLCWHLLQTLGNMTQEEITLEYGFSSYVKHTTAKINELSKTTLGRALIAGAESRFREEFERCLLYDD